MNDAETIGEILVGAGFRAVGHTAEGRFVCIGVPGGAGLSWFFARLMVAVNRKDCPYDMQEFLEVFETAGEADEAPELMEIRQQIGAEPNSTVIVLDLGKQVEAPRA